MNYHEWSQDLSALKPDTDNLPPPTLYHLFLFFEAEKKDTYTHVFKQRNQIVRFK